MSKTETDYFELAKEMIRGWPKWKQDIKCMPNSVNMYADKDKDVNNDGDQKEKS